MRLTYLTMYVLLSSIHGVAGADSIESRQEYIIDGHPVAAGETHATVRVVYTSEPDEPGDVSPLHLLDYVHCTGTLIAPNVVATAAHCVDLCVVDADCLGPDGDPAECEACEAHLPPEGTLFVAVGLRTLDDVWRAEIVAVEEVFIHDGWRAWGDWELDPDTGLGVGIHDLAVLVLASEVTAIQPVALWPVDAVPAPIAGLGQGYGLQAQVGSEALLRQEQVESPLNELESPIETITDEEILIGAGPDNAGLCFGDSGGPFYVSDGEELFLLGIAARATGSGEEEICGPGGVYTSASGHAEWILDKVRSAAPGSGRGCSANRNSSGGGVWAALGALLAWACFRRRRSRRALGPVVTLLVLGACGGGDSELADSTPARAPSAAFQEPGVARIELQSAERLAREAVPPDAWLWGASADGTRGLDEDGSAESWLFRYYVLVEGGPRSVVLERVTVSASGQVSHSTEIGYLVCVPTRPLQALDSQAAVRDAVVQLEEAGTGEGEEPGLSLVQLHICDVHSDNWNRISYGEHSVFYDESGAFLGLLDFSQL